MAKVIVSRRNNRVTALSDPIFNVVGSVVYFVGTPANDLVKIGVTDNFRDRFTHMASASPVSLAVYGLLTFKDRPSARKAEKAIHTLLTRGNRHSHGEWFRLPVDGLQPLVSRFSHLGVPFIQCTVASVVLDRADMPRDETYWRKPDIAFA